METSVNFYISVLSKKAIVGWATWLALSLLLIQMSQFEALAQEHNMITIIEKQIESSHLKLISAKSFQVKYRNYIAAVIENSNLVDRSIKIYSISSRAPVIDSEEYTSNIWPEELKDLRILDLKGNGIPDVVTISSCGQRGLLCISVVGFNFGLSVPQFKKIFVGQARKIDFGSQIKGKPIEIRLTDSYPWEVPEKRKEERNYIWDGKDFILKEDQITGSKGIKEGKGLKGRQD